MSYLMKAIESINDTDSYETVKDKLKQAYLADCMQELVDRLES